MKSDLQPRIERLESRPGLGLPASRAVLRNLKRSLARQRATCRVYPAQQRQEPSRLATFFSCVAIVLCIVAAYMSGAF